jgi:hypothetical protein
MQRTVQKFFLFSSRRFINSLSETVDKVNEFNKKRARAAVNGPLDGKALITTVE